METTKTSVHIFRSKLPDIDIPNHLPLHSYIFENLDLENRREKPCIIDGPTGRVYTYGEIELAARHYAAGLARIGISKGDVVMILLPNSPDFAIAFLGTSYRGGTATTANPFFTATEIAKQALASQARVIVTQSVHIEKLRELMSADSSLKVVVTGDHDHGITETGCLPMSELLTPTDIIREVDISPDDLVALPYSSGTTGLPKGVMLSHRSLVTSVGQHVDGENPNLYFSEDDVILCVLPMFHIYALTVVLLGGLRRGATVVAMPKFDMAAAMELVQRYRVTVAPFVPPVIQAIVKCPAVTESYDLSSIRMIITGAAPLGKQLHDAMQALLPNAKLGQGYGMTEAGPLSMSLGFAKVPFDVKPESCGTVVRNAEMKIIHPDHHSTAAPALSLPRNQPGEICVRGVQIMKGYLNDEEATKRTIDEEGWLHTGDVGYVDDNDELFVVDRLKELIKYKGFQVAPAELEALLNAHPAIAESAVVPMKDEAAGEIPVAFVVRSNAGTGEVTTEDDIKKYIAKQVVFYKKIHKVFFIESIPKAPSGKILRKNLRAMLEVIAI